MKILMTLAAAVALAVLSLHAADPAATYVDHDKVAEAFAKVKEAQDYSMSLMKPGADPKEIFAAYNAYMKKHGLPEEGRIHSHAQGYDIVQRPLIRFDEPMKLEADMFFAVHPAESKPNVFTFVCDNI